MYVYMYNCMCVYAYRHACMYACIYVCIAGELTSGIGYPCIIYFGAEIDALAVWFFPCSGTGFFFAPTARFVINYADVDNCIALPQSANLMYLYV